MEVIQKYFMLDPCLDSVKELLDELPEDERLHVVGEEGEELPVAHLAQLPDLLHQDRPSVDRLGPQVLLQQIWYNSNHL